MSDFDLVRSLNSVGKKVFVDYYVQFADPDLTTGEVADLLPHEYTLKARQSRASKGRKICREGLGRFALRIIASSDKVDPAAAQRARELLAGS
jgi:hypothetical protein